MCRSIEEMLKEEDKEIAIRMIDAGKVPLKEIAECTNLDIDTVRRLATEVKK